MNENQITKNFICNTDEGAIFLDAIMDYDNENMWATVKSIAKSFNVKESVVNNHLKNIFDEDDLDENSNILRIECSSYSEKFYSLDVIIQLAFKIKSENAIQFRRWAIRILRDFIIKGFVLDKEFLENNSRFGDNYFEGLSGHIDEIIRSKRTFCEKLTDLYSTSFDYNYDSQITQEFYSNVLTRLQYPLLGSSSNQCISLSENQISRIETIVTQCVLRGYFQAINKVPMGMKEWAKILNNVLIFIVDKIYPGEDDVDDECIKKFIKNEFENISPCLDNFSANFHELEERSKKLIND